MGKNDLRAAYPELEPDPDYPPLRFRSLKGAVSAAEWQTRLDCACAYRLVKHFGMDDLIYNHISAVERLNRDLNTVLRAPEMRQKIAEQGAETVGGPPEAFAQHIRAERDKWSRLIREKNIVVN